MSAYYMRISDWSSDVCSSDLFKIVVQGENREQSEDRDPAPERPVLGAIGHGPATYSLVCIECQMSAIEQWNRKKIEQAEHHREIGRTSCRERGDPYVKLSVCGVTLKKKQI